MDSLKNINSLDFLDVLTRNKFLHEPVQFIEFKSMIIGYPLVSYLVPVKTLRLASETTSGLTSIETVNGLLFKRG